MLSSINTLAEILGLVFATRGWRLFDVWGVVILGKRHCTGVQRQTGQEECVEAWEHMSHNLNSLKRVI